MSLLSRKALPIAEESVLSPLQAMKAVLDALPSKIAGGGDLEVTVTLDAVSNQVVLR